MIMLLSSYRVYGLVTLNGISNILGKDISYRKIDLENMANSLGWTVTKNCYIVRFKNNWDYEYQYKELKREYFKKMKAWRIQ